MSQFIRTIQELHEQSHGFEKLREGLSDEVIEEVCAYPDVTSKRTRKLPSVKMVWLLVGLGLCRNQAIHKVAENFGLFAKGTAPSSGSVSDARKRLGADALRRLFRKLGEKWCALFNAQDYCGLKVLGIDGTTITLEDTKANVSEFGKPGSRSEKSPAARPQARAVGVMELSTKLLIDAEVVSLSKGENTALQPLLSRIPSKSLSVLDRGFQSKGNFFRLTSGKGERHFLCRVKKTFNPRWVKDLTPASWLGELEFTQSEREHDPTLPAAMQVRVIEYRVDGYKDTIRLTTSLLHESTHPAHELVSLYNERWEFELGLRDLKVTLLESKSNIRSKSPEMVRQEIWAIFLAYNLVRHEAATVAYNNGVSPRRISFKTTLEAVSNFFRVFASGFANIELVPEAVQELRNNI